MSDQSSIRTKNYLKQVKGSSAFKLGAIIASFLAIPIMIKYLGVEVFGIWATMLTLLTWVMLFDLGIGNGLKNKILESLAQDDRVLASRYISTAYVIIGGISLVLFVVFVLVSYWLPWQSIFNSKLIEEVVLRNAVITLSFFIFLNFWISLVAQVYHGIQKSSMVVLGQFISNSFALFLVYLLYKYAESSILYMVLIYGLSLVISNVFLSYFLFSKQRDLRPSVVLFDYQKIKPLFTLGLQFFVIQLAVLFMFMTDKILITQLLGPSEVTPYEVLFKLFSVFSILHSLILLPLWPAYSDAYAKGDMYWIRKQMRKQIFIAVLLFLFAFLLAVLGPLIINIWIGEAVKINQSLYYMFAIFIVLSIWSNVFAYFVNAIGVLNVQLTTAVIAACLNIPLSIYFVKVYDMGLDGIVLATIISLSVYSMVGPIQVYRILKQKVNLYG